MVLIDTTLAGQPAARPRAGDRGRLRPGAHRGPQRAAHPRRRPDRGRRPPSDDDFLQLPHPRARERAFVLLPWLDLEPDAVLLDAGPVADLLDEHRPERRQAARRPGARAPVTLTRPTTTRISSSRGRGPAAPDRLGCGRRLGVGRARRRLAAPPDRGARRGTAPIVTWLQPLALFFVAAILGGTAWVTWRAAARAPRVARAAPRGQPAGAGAGVRRWWARWWPAATSGTPSAGSVSTPSSPAQRMLRSVVAAASPGVAIAVGSAAPRACVSRPFRRRDA